MGITSPVRLGVFEIDANPKADHATYVLASALDGIESKGIDVKYLSHDERDLNNDGRKEFVVTYDINNDQKADLEIVIFGSFNGALVDDLSNGKLGKFDYINCSFGYEKKKPDKQKAQRICKIDRVMQKLDAYSLRTKTPVYQSANNCKKSKKRNKKYPDIDKRPGVYPPSIFLKNIKVVTDTKIFDSKGHIDYSSPEIKLETNTKGTKIQRTPDVEMPFGKDLIGKGSYTLPVATSFNTPHYVGTLIAQDLSSP